jgi:hypothetical protein
MLSFQLSMPKKLKLLDKPKRLEKLKKLDKLKNKLLLKLHVKPKSKLPLLRNKVTLLPFTSQTLVVVTT